jgi:DNA-binding NtrC family response regulator
MVRSILVLDRDRKDLETCERDLISLGYHPIITPDVEDAERHLNSERPALLLTDILSLAGSGSKLLHSAHDVHPQVPVVILTGIATIDAAVQALKEGAQFYLLKPINPDHLKAALERVIPPSHQDSDQRETGPQPQNTAGEIIVGASRVIREVLDIAGRVAHSDANIVLFGESGTGKELFARTIHACSNRLLVLLRQVNVMSFCRQAGQRPNMRISTICRLRRASGSVGTRVFLRRRRAFCPCRKDRSGSGQSQYPQTGVVVRSVSTRRSAPSSRAF